MTDEKCAGRCERCSHWDAAGDEREEYDNENDRDVIFPHRRCLLVVHLYHRGTDRFDPSRAAYVMDASGYRATLWTAPSFGCVLFEPRKAPP